MPRSAGWLQGFCASPPRNLDNCSARCVDWRAKCACLPWVPTARRVLSMKLARGLIKAIALMGGACVTLLCLMSWIGTQTDSGWLRASGALAAMVVVPLVLVELALRFAKKEGARGVASDVLALGYLGFALGYAGVAHAYTRPLLEGEAHRL